MNNSKSKKNGRFLSIMTYLPIEQCRLIMAHKESSLRAWAMIYHDKDETESHVHIIVRTHSVWTCSQICKWFTAVDETGKPINTFAEFVSDRLAIMEYLTHQNDPDKYQYSVSEVIASNIDDLTPDTTACDSTMEIVEKMLLGRPTRELVRLYGRDFVYHYSSYKMIVDAIEEEENSWLKRL